MVGEEGPSFLTKSRRRRRAVQTHRHLCRSFPLSEVSVVSAESVLRRLNFRLSTGIGTSRVLGAESIVRSTDVVEAVAARP